MTKQSGLGDNLYVGGVDLSGDTQQLGRVGGGPAAIDVTGIDKSARERIGGLRTGSIEWRTFFNDASGQAHLTLSTLPRTDRVVTYCRGTTLGNAAACCVGKQIGYDATRDDSGELTLGVDVQSNGFGVEWGRLLTAGKRTDTSATNGTAVDFAAAGSNGLQAYVHVFAFTGTDVTLTIQESSDNAVGDPFAAVVGGAFTQVTSAPTSQRVATAAGLTVERYLRVVSSTSGGFTSVTFAVVAVRNDTAVVF